MTKEAKEPSELDKAIAGTAKVDGEPLAATDIVTQLPKEDGEPIKHQNLLKDKKVVDSITEAVERYENPTGSGLPVVQKPVLVEEPAEPEPEVEKIGEDKNLEDTKKILAAIEKNCCAAEQKEYPDDVNKWKPRKGKLEMVKELIGKLLNKPPVGEDSLVIFTCKLSVQRFKHVNRASYDEQQLQGFIMNKRIRNIDRIEITRHMKPAKDGFYVTVNRIFYKAK